MWIEMFKTLTTFPEGKMEIREKMYNPLKVSQSGDCILVPLCQ